MDSKCGHLLLQKREIWTQKTSNLDTFHAVGRRLPYSVVPCRKIHFWGEIFFILKYFTYLSFNSRDVMYIKYLTHFFPMFPFYTSLNHQESFGFLMYSCGIKRKHWKKPIKICTVVCRVIYSSCSRIFKLSWGGVSEFAI